MPAFSVPANFAFDTYGALVSALEDWLDRDDLDGSAQQMIALCEARLNRELAPYFLEKSDSVVASNGFAAFPADYGMAVRVMYDGHMLPQRSVYAAPEAVPGPLPDCYTIEGSGIRFWPSGDYTATLLYRPRLPKLSDATPTCELLSRHPDLYFYGSMMFAEGYLANDERAGLFKGLWDESIAEAKSYFTRQKAGGQLVPRFHGVP